MNTSAVSLRYPTLFRRIDPALRYDLRMGRTSGFVITWPVTFETEDGRTFLVTRSDLDGALEIGVEGRDDWLAMGPSYGEQTSGAVIGRALRWWYETTGEPIVIAKRSS